MENASTIRFNAALLFSAAAILHCCSRAFVSNCWRLISCMSPSFSFRSFSALPKNSNSSLVVSCKSLRIAEARGSRPLFFPVDEGISDGDTSLTSLLSLPTSVCSSESGGFSVDFDVVSFLGIEVAEVSCIIFPRSIARFPPNFCFSAS